MGTPFLNESPSATSKRPPGSLASGIPGFCKATHLGRRASSLICTGLPKAHDGYNNYSLQVPTKPSVFIDSPIPRT
jgi:hypothetical protein